MKVFGVFDPGRERDELGRVLNAMASSMNHGSYVSDVFLGGGLGLGRMYFDFIREDAQPIWNEDGTRCIVMVGDIFDYEDRRRELVDGGHKFRYRKNDAEFVLHGLEEWGRDLILELNGVFNFVIFDAETGTFTVVNDRYGMKPLYYYHDEPFFIFASEVKAIIRDGKVPKEIDWDGWHDIFSYGYLIGNKTVFRNIHSLHNAAILTLDADGISSDKYWRYDQVEVDHESSERDLVDEGVRLFRQAVERQTRNLEKCVVPLSAGYDSRGIACAIKKFTDVDLETFTYRACDEDVIFAREIADLLNVDNHYFPRPRDIVEKYLVDMVYLNDGMRILIPPPPTTMMLLQYARERSKVPEIHLMGLAAIILRGRSPEKDILKDIMDDRKFTMILDKKMRRAVKVDIFFHNSIREKLRPTLKSLFEEIGQIEKRENRMMIFNMRNNQKNSMSRYATNMLSVATNCYFPYLDNDFFEYSLSVPPMMKHNKGIMSKIFKILFNHSTIIPLHFKILKKMCPHVMKISSTRYPVFSRFYLSTLARSKNQKKRILQLFLLHIKNYIVERSAWNQIKLTNEQVRRELKYMIDLLKSLEIPPFINREKVLEKIKHYLKNNKDPSRLIIPILEFCIWYNLFINNIPPSEITRKSRSSTIDRFETKE